jgi:hypothetical protein
VRALSLRHIKTTPARAKAANSLTEKNAVGVGIFVTVNEMDGRGRKSENFKAST